MVIIGFDLIFVCLCYVFEIVGGFSKKEVKVWEKFNESLKLLKNDVVDEV